MKKVELFRDPAQQIELLETYIGRQAVKKSPLRILEAGCGQRWPLELGGIRYTLTGVDIDGNALEIRKTKTKDLDEIIIGDLRYIDLKKNEYDVIYNSFVLEHIQNAEKILDNFTKWLKPGGLLILRIPDRDSVYGFLTRITPFWFHIFFKRYIMGNRNAGKPGFAPYPTFHERIVSRNGIHEYCRENNYIIREEYGEGFFLNNSSKGAATVLVRGIVNIGALLSFGKLKKDYNNLTYILEKKDEPGL